MGRKPTVVCAGILNTKGEEIRLLAERVRTARGRAITTDLGLGVESEWADIPLGRVLEATGTSTEEVFALDRTSAIEVVGRAGALKISRLEQEGGIDGIVALDLHILDSPFAEFLDRCIDDMLEGRWHKGLYRDTEGVVATISLR